MIRQRQLVAVWEELTLSRPDLSLGRIGEGMGGPGAGPRHIPAQSTQSVVDEMITHTHTHTHLEG